MPEDSANPNAGKLVMIVDDDDAVRELLEFVVKREGFRTATALNGEDGINLIRSIKPDAVILDMMMPKYGGFEVLRSLQDGDTARIPIIIITGRHTDRTTAEMIKQESNVVDFLEKPVKPAVLVMCLHRALGTKPKELEGAQGDL